MLRNTNSVLTLSPAYIKTQDTIAGAARRDGVTKDSTFPGG